MEELIKNIVEADRAARSRVSEKLHARDNVHLDVLEKRNEVISKYRQESQKRIEEMRSQLEKELEEAKALEEVRYQNTLEQLNKQVEAHRGEWVCELIARCLHTDSCS